MSHHEPDFDELVTPALLSIIDPDPVVAEARFRKLMADLRRSLEWWGCRDPDDVAAESVYRALKRISEGVDTTASGFRAYVFGIAKLVVKEGWKTDGREQQLDSDGWERREARQRDHERADAQVMLRQIQRLLSQDQWEMLLRYCSEDNHEQHSRDLDVSPGYLRVMVHRVREQLKAKALFQQEQKSDRRGARRQATHPAEVIE